MMQPVSVHTIIQELLCVIVIGSVTRNVMSVHSLWSALPLRDQCRIASALPLMQSLPNVCLIIEYQCKRQQEA